MVQNFLCFPSWDESIDASVKVKNLNEKTMSVNPWHESTQVTGVITSWIMK